MSKRTIHYHYQQQVQKPIQEIHGVLMDFTTWKEWHPVLHNDPDIQITVQGNGRDKGTGISWKSGIFGEGELLRGEVSSTKIQHTFRYKKPVPLEVSYEYTMEMLPYQVTMVNLSVTVYVPWYLFFLKSFLKKGFHFLNGVDDVLLLKYFIEQQKPAYHLMPYPTMVPLPDVRYVAMEISTSWQQWLLEKWDMVGMFHERIKEHHIVPSGPLMIQYYRRDPVQDVVHGLISIPVEHLSGVLPEGLVKGELSGGLFQKLAYRGDLRFVEQGWECCALAYGAKGKVPSGVLLEIYQRETNNSDGSEGLVELYTSSGISI